MIRAITWFRRLNRKNKLAVVLSAIWMLAVPAFVVPYGDEAPGRLEHFFWWGLFPVFLYWGRHIWVRKWLR